MNILPENILFHVIDSVSAGYIAVVLTPIDVWDLTESVAEIYDYSVLKMYLEELELVEMEPSVFEHRGLMGIDEFSSLLEILGFQKNPIFSIYVTALFAQKMYFPYNEGTDEIL